MHIGASLDIVENDNAAFRIALADVEALGGGLKPKVAVTVGSYTFRSSIAKYGDEFFIPFNKSRRAESGIEPGANYDLEIRLDTAPRVVDVPDDLAARFQANPAASAAWDKLSFSAQSNLIAPVITAKKPETRERNLAKLIAKLS